MECKNTRIALLLNKSMECINTHAKMKNVHILFRMYINVSWQQLWNAKILESLCYLIKSMECTNTRTKIKNVHIILFRVDIIDLWQQLCTVCVFFFFLFALCSFAFKERGAENRYNIQVDIFITYHIQYFQVIIISYYTAFSGNNQWSRF